MFCYRKVETAKASPTLPRSECLRLVLCWVDSYLWSSWAPDFRPWECVQDSEPISIWSAETTWYGRSGAKPISQAVLNTFQWPKIWSEAWSEVTGNPTVKFLGLAITFLLLAELFFMENHFPVATCQNFFPKFKIMTSVYFIGKNHDKFLLHIQDATGKKKLAPERSGNAMVSPEKTISTRYKSLS